jgi:hypothetical protein
MELTVTLVVGAATLLLLVGFVLGARFEETNLELRERRLARQRRALREAAAGRHSLEGADQ